MKRLKHILIKHKRLIGVSFGTLIAILLFNAANQSYQTQRCEAVQIRFNQTEPRFITKADIHQKIDYHFTDSLVNRPYQAIPLDHLEKIINTIPHIRSTRVYTGVHGTLSIEIEQREPLLRVINRPYVDYYIDENGYRMPISNKFTPRVIVANGHFRDPNHENDTIRDPMIQQLRTIALYLHRHPYWEAQIEQIYVNRDREFELVPRIGSHIIRFGDTTNMTTKFKKLGAFYRESLQHIGWNKYKTINLKYENQIVCQKF